MNPVAGLFAVIHASLLLTVLPGRFGVGGYVASFVVLTFGYAIFQAGNMTATMHRTVSDDRGVTSALPGLSRNTGLIWGASAMAALYATGPRLAEAIGSSAGSGAGLTVVFMGATSVVGASLGAVVWGHSGHRLPDK